MLVAEDRAAAEKLFDLRFSVEVRARSERVVKVVPLAHPTTTAASIEPAEGGPRRCSIQAVILRVQCRLSGFRVPLRGPGMTGLSNERCAVQTSWTVR
jgi:hypothetical protein